jgi:hypothetical protein
MMKKRLLISGFLIAMVFLLSGCGGPGEYAEFAQCTADSGAVMYGAYWCPHCVEQKQDFGKDADLINYVECSLPNRQGQTQICNAADIKGYPTWEFADGERMSGRISLQTIATKTGCTLPE